MFAVCRGKVSEGVDFSDELCRAVFLVGVPYPPIQDKRIGLKKEYLDKIFCDNSLNPT
jgi:regulator of telomere elongation helicase 1